MNDLYSIKRKALGNADPAQGQFAYLSEAEKSTKANSLLTALTNVLQSGDLNTIGTQGKDLYTQIANLANGSNNVDVQKAFTSATGLVNTVGTALQPYNDVATKVQSIPSALPATDPAISNPSLVTSTKVVQNNKSEAKPSNGFNASGFFLGVFVGTALGYIGHLLISKPKQS